MRLKGNEPKYKRESGILLHLSSLPDRYGIGSLGGDASAGMTVSSVPWWLALLGIGFAVLVGVISGVSPANRAVKVSALKAIHNE